MSPERWKLVELLFNESVDLPTEERERFLNERCGTDQELLGQVQSLLSSLDSSDSFIEVPVWTDSNFLNTSAKRELSKSLVPTYEAGIDEMIGRTIGVYRLDKQIGRGGMGTVYKAERADGEFKQTVAIKLIKRGMDSDFIVRRFRHERQILASFEHPFIARLLDGGTTTDGTPYFVMEFIEGETLYKYCDQKTLPIRDRLKLFQKVCSAVEYAHERQIVHRDIKPGNILINQSGAPKLLDFGIAKILDPELIHESLNPTGSMLRMMTPDYASPEQVRGQDVAPSSDIYSLGILLYELITGHRPYALAGRSIHEVSRAVCDVMPPLPSEAMRLPDQLLSQYGSDESRVSEYRGCSPEELRSALLEGLDDVIMKALSKRPEDRYLNVKEFSKDLTRYLNGTPIAAPRFNRAMGGSKTNGKRKQERGKAIAVLPFKFINLGVGGDTDDRFLGLGLTDALIARLSKIRSFVVRPTSSILAFGDTVFDPISAGRDLNVDLILDGNIKKANDRLRVTIQLLNVGENSAIWATSIDEKLTDVLTLEDTLASKVIEALLPQLTGSDVGEIAKRGTDSPEAFEEYLRGRYHFNSFTEEGLAKAFVSFHAAIAADPGYALAYVGIADYYNWLGIIGVLPPQECYLPAIEAASRSVELDPDLSEAHATLGFSLHAGRYDWAGAEKHLKKAIELNPGNAVAYVWYSIVLYTEGRFDEALDLARRGVELDPLTPFNHHNVGWGLYYARRYDEAIKIYQKVIEDFPDYSFGHYGLSKIYRIIGRTKEAIKENQRAKELMGESVFSLLAEAECLAADGQTNLSRQKLVELGKLAEERFVSPYQVSLVYAFLGDKENVISCLKQAYERKEAWLNWMGVDPALNLVRESSEYNSILEEIGYRQFFVNFALSGTNLLDAPRPVGNSGGGRDRMHDLTTLVIDDGHQTADGSTLEYITPNWKRWIVAAVIMVAVLSAIGSIYYFKGPSDPKMVVVKSAGFQNPALLVLPFRGNDPATETIGVGLADALTQRLGNIKSISVLSANTGRSLAGRNVTEIASEFGVSFVMRGDIRNEAGSAVLEVELLNANTGTVLWDETFRSDAGNYFELQSKVADRFWRSLKIEPLPMELRQLEKSYTQSVSAYEKYLIGRSQMANRTSEGLRRAIASFAAAIKDDAGFAPAFVGLADAHSLLNLYDIRPPEDAYSKAREYALTALSIDGELAEAHASLAYIKFYFERDRIGAELEFRRSIQTNPSYAQAHHWFALALAAMNKPIDALTEIKIAERLDPSSLSIKSAAGIVYFYAGKYDEGIAECDRALKQDPGFVPAFKVKRWIFSAKGDLDSARESLERERLLSGGDASLPGWQIISLQLSDIDPDSKRTSLENLEKVVRDDDIRTNPFTYSVEIALAFLHLGDRENALKWLSKAEATGTHSFNLIDADPRFSELRRDPRFEKLTSTLKNK